MTKRAAERLGALLEAERVALLAGDLVTVGELADQKDALVAEIDEGDSAELSKLAGPLARNAGLLAAARDGVTTVLTTLKQQRAARLTLSTYDSAGKPATITQHLGKTERHF